MTAALVTAALLGIGGLGYCTFLGFLASTPEDIARHVSFGIFFTLITLLAHSMTMFYLIGKGKAIREAATEAGLPEEIHLAVARARRPVFSWGTLAMALTMLAAILGGGVDTGALPAGIHSSLAVLALLANFFVFKLELLALATAADSTAEVNRQVE
ncbi:MAG: hypothetical protein F4Y45_03180 [Acidobacteria bacterium]|nr:hypothetical protein [Acidobacteriota bacterium]MYJ05779.1 hypothetical protein [Acidobacteriota bacterium]